MVLQVPTVLVSPSLVLRRWPFYVGILVLIAAVYAAWPNWNARVVDVIPKVLENEEWQNSEPTLAVDPSNPSRISVSAMFLGSEGIECGDLKAGVVTSADKGHMWSLQCVLPLKGDPTDQFPDWAGDHSFDAVGSGDKVYAAYLTPGYVLTARILETEITKLFASTITILQDFEDTDQPQIDANHDPGSDEYSVSASMSEETSNCRDDATRDAVVYAGTGAPTTPTCFQNRVAAFETPAVRSAWHSSGTIYTVYYLPFSWSQKQTHVVVAKATKGAGGTVFGAIVDGPASNGNSCNSRDGLPGFRVARCVDFPWNIGPDPNFGQERRQLSHLSIAVHPNDENRVYVAWGDVRPGDGSLLTLHVRSSHDGGVSWDNNDLTSVTNATNPALAINKDGRVGFAYQQLNQRDGATWWDTIFILADPDFLSTRQFVLAQTKSDTPEAIIMPYLGDYMDLKSVGGDFYGVFSANNQFSQNAYPQGLKYWRRPGGAPLMVGFGAQLPVSIDPYFYAIEHLSPFTNVMTFIAKYVGVSKR